MVDVHVGCTTIVLRIESRSIKKENEKKNEITICKNSKKLK